MNSTSCTPPSRWPSQMRERFRIPVAGQTLINVRQQAWVVTQVAQGRVELVLQDDFHQGLADQPLRLTLEEFWAFCRRNGIVPPLIR